MRQTCIKLVPRQTLLSFPSVFGTCSLSRLSVQKDRWSAEIRNHYTQGKELQWEGLSRVNAASRLQVATHSERAAASPGRISSPHQTLPSKRTPGTARECKHKRVRYRQGRLKQSNLRTVRILLPIRLPELQSNSSCSLL